MNNKHLLFHNIYDQKSPKYRCSWHEVYHEFAMRVLARFFVSSKSLTTQGSASKPIIWLVAGFSSSLGVGWWFSLVCYHVSLSTEQLTVGSWLPSELNQEIKKDCAQPEATVMLKPKLRKCHLVTS